MEQRYRPMLSTNTEEFIPTQLAKAIANPLFPELDTKLRGGRHISSEDMDNFAFLVEFEQVLSTFYQRYNVEFIRAPENFFYLTPRSTSFINRSVLSELDMLVGKVLCFLYLSPERLAQEGIFSNEDVIDELISLADQKKLMKLVTNKASGSDLDRVKLAEKVNTSLRRLRRIGMIIMFGEQGKFHISESVFRFGAEVRSGDDPHEAQLRLVRSGEAMLEDQQIDQQNERNDEINGELF